MGRILGLDYGRKRIGIAISDPLGITAQPLETLEEGDDRKAIERVACLVQCHQVGTIVIGCPLTLRGEKGHSVKMVERFIQQMEKRLSVPIVKWDERLSSAEAERYLKTMKIKPSRQKGKIDQIASVLILQNYMDFQKGSLLADPGRIIE